MSELRFEADVAAERVRHKALVPPYLQTKIGELVGEATMAWSPQPTGVFNPALAGRCVDDIIELVGRHLMSRDVSLLAGLQTISYHSGALQKRIRDRSGIE